MLYLRKYPFALFGCVSLLFESAIGVFEFVIGVFGFVINALSILFITFI